MNKDMRRVNFTISEENYEYIKQVMKKCGLKQSPALEKIIEEHEGSNVENEVEDIKKRVIRNNYILNNLDKKMDILISVINSIALNENYEIYVSPEKRKSPLYEGSSKEVETKKAKELTITRKKRDLK